MVIYPTSKIISNSEAKNVDTKKNSNRKLRKYGLCYERKQDTAGR